MFVLKATHRDLKDKGDKLRKYGYIPGIIYGGDLKAPIPIQLDAAYILRLLGSYDLGDSIDLSLDGILYHTLIQDMAVHPITNKLVHMDFQLLSKTSQVN